MESDLSLSDSESSTGSSSLSTGIMLAFPATTSFRCSECFRLFPSERTLIDHQRGSGRLCNIPTKALGFLRRFKFAQQAIPPPPPPPNPPPPTLPPLLPPPPPQRPYYQRTTSLAPAPLTLSLAPSNTVAEGSATHNPFGGRGDHNKPSLKTVDLLSLMDPPYAARPCPVQFPGPSGYGGYSGSGACGAAPGASSGKEALDLDLKL